MTRTFAWRVLPLALVILSACAKPPQEDPVDQFQGVWRVTITGDGGQKINKEALFQHDSCRIASQVAPKPGEEIVAKLEHADVCVIQVDNKTTPGKIDFVTIYGDEQGAARQGIYAFEQGKLKICLAAFGVARPTEFAPGEKTVLMEFERK